MKISRSWLQTYFSEIIPPAEALAELFTFHAFEVEGVERIAGSCTLDLDILPNRSSDCLSHRGVAREVSTLLGIPMKTDPLREALPLWKKPKFFEISVDDTDVTRRYMAAVVRGVRVGPSPAWLSKVLESIGQKSINNVVDATNYVMYNIGQPVHAFDEAKLAKDENGNKGIRIRAAKEGERIVTLTGDEYALKSSHNLITDAVTGTPLALAGIKGGKFAEVTESTTELIIEVANFDPVSVRRTSGDLKLQTDASLRFQNHVPPELAAFAMRDILELLKDIADGSEAGVLDSYEGMYEREPVVVTQHEIHSLLGAELSIEEIESILVRLEWEFSRDGTSFTVTGPWERTDITIKENVIEEIGRIYGYENIKKMLPLSPKQAPKVNKVQYYTEKVEKMFMELGYSEVLTYTLSDRGIVELANPLASDKKFMRMNLRNGMEQVLALNVQNAPLFGLSSVKLFEIGTIFTDQGERLSFCAGIRAVQGKQKDADICLEEDVRALFTLFNIEETVQIQNGIFEIELHNVIPLLPNPKSYKQPLLWDATVRYERWSPYPFVLRDLAVWTPASVSSEEVLGVICEHGSQLLVRHDLFDTFEKDEKISYAWHLVFQSKDGTLTDNDVNEIMKKMYAGIGKHSEWEVR